jgi:hypothetical protein
MEPHPAIAYLSSLFLAILRSRHRSPTTPRGQRTPDDAAAFVEHGDAEP